MRLYNLILVIVLIFFNSCGKVEKEEIVLVEKSLKSQVAEAYKEGMKSLEKGDVLFAAKKFNEAEILFPQSEWAPKSALMAAYSYYIQDYYGDAVSELQRFLKIYPKHNNIDYANYLLAICYYEQIVDEKKDLQSIIKAKKQFSLILRSFPNTEYAEDAEFKLDLINDILASKEMYIGRYYFNKKKWISSINRFRNVVDHYETTIYAQEALHRLVEIYYTIGLEEEAKKYAKVLGYNYQSSQWYEKSYSVFNLEYEKNKKAINKASKKKHNIVLKKFKSLFD
jgi:outer membrane protein assembly factor BamD